MERLPNEVLSRIFRFVVDCYSELVVTQTIHALRLVSRRIKSIATAFLIRSATVELSAESFSKFEELCRHPEYRLSITRMRINAAFYDVQMAEDRGYFSQHCSSLFYRSLEIWERSGHRRDRRAQGKWTSMWKVPDQIRAMANEDFNESRATPHQRIIMDYHKEYQKLTADQEELRRDNDHLRRLCEALTQLPALDTIHVDDRNMERRSTFKALNDITIPVDDPRNLVLATARLMWTGSFETAYRTRQPVEMLGELLARLGRSNVRPRSINIELSVPTDLCKFQISEEQSHGIHDLVSKVRDVSITFDHWPRKGSLAENNDRSISEMSALGSVTRALTTTSTLETLSLGLLDYPVFYQFPNVSAHALLPLHTIQWPSLYHVRLRHVPMNMDDLELLVRSQRDTITSLEMQSPFLLTEDWDKAIERLAELKKLEHVSVQYPRGGRYRDRYDHNNRFPDDEACQYILGKSPENPLRAIAELPE